MTNHLLPGELLARAPVKFEVTEEFYCEALQSRYLPGLTYTIRPPDRLLAGHVALWIQQGRARVVSGAPAQVLGANEAKVGGTGVVG